MIEFPELGLEYTIERVAFKVLNVPIYWYGIIIAFGFLLAVVLGMRNSSKYGIDPENIIDLVLIAVPVSIILARLYYVVFNWSEFSSNILSVFNTRRGGLAIYGGIIGALLSAYIFAKLKKIRILNLLDFGVPYLVLAQAIGRWGNFVNQEAFGTNTLLPWGMTGDEIRNQLAIYQQQGMDVTPDLPVHPTFLYESILNFSIFLFLIWYRKRKKKEGEVFFLYMIFYGLGRFFIEGLRTDSLMLGGFRVSKVLALILAATFIILFIVKRLKSAELEGQEAGIGSSSYGAVLRELEENKSEGITDAPDTETTEEKGEHSENEPDSTETQLNSNEDIAVENEEINDNGGKNSKS